MRFMVTTYIEAANEEEATTIKLAMMDAIDSNPGLQGLVDWDQGVEEVEEE